MQSAIEVQSEQSPYDQLIEALMFLAGRCDGARTFDDMGFNKFDSDFGKSLATQSQTRQLSIAQQKAALKMTKKYKGQLERANIGLPTEAELLAELDSTPNAPAGRIELEGDYIVVSFPYDKERVQQTKNIGGGKWNPDLKHWLFPLDDAKFHQILETFPDFTLDPRIKERIKIEEEGRWIEMQRKQAEVEMLFSRVGDLSQPIGQITLFKHQQDGVKFMLERGRVIVADEMGTGKTLQSLVSAKAYDLPVLVICPVSLKVNWLREAQKVDVPIEVFSWAGIPEPLETREYVVIGDESHAIQNLRSQRTEAFLKLALHENAKAVYCLTGTPIKNGRPSNIFPLLVAIKHPLSNSRSAFEKRYCNAGPTRFSKWDATGAAHLDELHEKIKDSMLRRTKIQCLDLPPKIRQLRPIELDESELRIYHSHFRQMQMDYEERKERGEIMDGGEALVLINHLRHSGSLAKAFTASELAEEITEQGNQVVFYTCFKDTADNLMRNLNSQKIIAQVLSGDTPEKDRQKMIDDFQKGIIQCLVCIFGAGGVGITLTKANYVILIDRPWTPGDAVQAEDRLHRIGQHAAVNAIWLQLQDSNIDAKIDQVLIQKQERIDLVLQGKRKTMRGIPSIEQMAMEVIRSIMEKKDVDIEQYEGTELA